MHATSRLVAPDSTPESDALAFEVNDAMSQAVLAPL